MTAASAVAPPISSGAYVLVSSAGFALDDPSGGAVTPDQAAYSGANQNWTVTLVGSSEYKIVSASGYALTSGTGNGTIAALSSYTGASNQLWSFAAIGGNTYGVVNVGTGLVLDDHGGGAGTVCNQWNWAGTPHQLWTVVATSAALPPLANGVYRFVNAAGFALDNPSGDGAQATANQIPYSGAAEDWTVTLVTGFEYENHRFGRQRSHGRCHGPRELHGRERSAVELRVGGRRRVLRDQRGHGHGPRRQRRWRGSGLPTGAVGARRRAYPGLDSEPGIRARARSARSWPSAPRLS